MGFKCIKNTITMLVKEMLKTNYIEEEEPYPYGEDVMSWWS